MLQGNPTSPTNNLDPKGQKVFINLHLEPSSQFIRNRATLMKQRQHLTLQTTTTIHKEGADQAEAGVGVEVKARVEAEETTNKRNEDCSASFTSSMTITTRNRVQKKREPMSESKKKEEQK